ncbi:hypothetical protein Trydic_g17141 [Trypoxylus dichotomus]
MLVSFEVTLRFTQVPINETVDIISSKHRVENHLINLTEHCLRNTYFTSNSQKYRQTEGATMGSPLASAIGNIFMENFEARAQDTFFF